MIRTGIRVLLIALSMQFVLPFVKGFQFHGSFLSSLLLSAGFTASYFLAGTLIGMGFQAFTGDAENGRKMVPLRLVLFWAVSCALLVLAGQLLPALLTVSGWLPILLGGLLMLYIGIATSKSACANGSCRTGIAAASCSIRNVGPNRRNSVAALFDADSDSCSTGRCTIKPVATATATATPTPTPEKPRTTKPS